MNKGLSEECPSTRWNELTLAVTPLGEVFHGWVLTLLSAQGLRDMTEQEGALLCFDEVMTGFR